METLLGNHDNLLQVLSIFAADPKVGLVFAEDRHCVGWTKNRVFAEKLASNLRPRPILKDFPFFPLGTMFWTRPAVLEPLWQLGLEAADFPGEPVPYDGSILHAIERMLPAICESTDHSWCTVYRNGTAW
jgi:lipopolysaccharide biosynthesis protein